MLLKEDKINEVVERFYSEKPLQDLLELISEQIDSVAPFLNKSNNLKRLIKEAEERVIRFPKIKITERWGEKNNEDREILETLMSRVKGGTVSEKISSVNSFLSYQQNLPVPDILSNLMFVEIFSNIIEEYNASTAGFLFEAFLAGLFSGLQIADPEQVGAAPGSLPIEDVTLAIQRKDQPEDEIVPYSLKVLSPGTDLKGSFKNIVDYFASGRQDNIVYLVVTKAGEGTLLFNEFTITQQNFLEYIGHEVYKREKVYKPVEFSPRDLMEPRRTKAGEKFQLTKKWMQSNRVNRVTTADGQPAPALLDPEQKYVAYQWGGEKEDFRMVAAGGLTANAKKLYGSQEVYDKALSKKDGNDFWQYLSQTPGYINEQQFHISPENYRRRTDNLGALDLYPPKLLQLGNKYAEDLGAGLVDLYNAVSDLSININKYFIASDKMAGMSAIRNAETIRKEANEIIEGEAESVAASPQPQAQPQRRTRAPRSSVSSMSSMQGTRQRAEE